MGGTCSAFGERRGVYRVLVENQRERDHLGDPGVDLKITLRHQQEVGCGDVDWSELAQDRNRWRAVVNEVMNLRDP